MRINHRCSVILLALGFLATGGCLNAQQSTGTISGLVADASGALIDGATVVVKNLETGAVRELVTDKAGRYDAPSLAVGPYSVTAAKIGFQSSSRTGIALVVGQQAQEDLTLVVGELKQVITVEEKPPVVNVSTAQTAGLVGERQVKELPLNGRSYDGLMSLNPGVVNYSSERAGGVGTSNSAIGNMFSVSGRRPQESVFLLNGVEYTSASEINLSPGGASGQLLGVDAVREFNVVTDAYGAEFGKRPGAQVSIVTSSGTNQIHGSVYEFARNSAFDARNFFDQTSVPALERNEFGGAIGGPVRKDKTFLFGNYEGYRQRLGLSDVTLVPDTQSRLSAVAGVQPFLSLWPVQSGPGSEVGGGIAKAYSNPLQRIREDFGTARVDQALSAKDNFSGVYTVDDSADRTPAVNPLIGIEEALREQVISLQETHVFSPRLVNTARVGFSRGSFVFDSYVEGSTPGFFAGSKVGALVIGGGTASNSATQISPAGANVASNTLAVRNLFTYEDQVDFNAGIHHIQAGVWIQRIQSNDLFAQGQYGQASFSSLSNFLQGNISTFTAVPNATPLGWRSTEFAEYVQDTIRLRPNLEVKLGLRIESTNGWNEAHGRASNYLFTNGVIQTQQRVAGGVFTVNRAKFLPEPRVGIAWDPFGHSNTAIHAGFGMYNALLDNLSYRLDQNAPFNTTVAIKNVPISSIHLIRGASLPSLGLVAPAGVQPDAYTPTILSYTLKIDQKLTGNTGLAIGYVGSHGYHEILSVDTNTPFPTILPSGAAYYAPGSKLANRLVAASTTWLTEGISSYNALQVDVNHHLSSGLQVRGVYTFSKSLDDGGTLNNSVGNNTPAFVSVPYAPKVDWGPSPFNVKHLAVLNGTYELPFGRGKTFPASSGSWANRLAAGWQLSGVASFQSGFPFTPQLGFNPSNNGDTRNPVRPSWNPNFTGDLYSHGVNGYYNANAFSVPANGTYGNVGRDVLTGPGLATVDFSVLKNTAIRERMNLQFRAEFFNLLNHANFNTPNPVVYTSATGAPAPTAGVITSTATTSRQIQFGLKLLF